MQHRVRGNGLLLRARAGAGRGGRSPILSALLETPAMCNLEASRPLSPSKIQYFANATTNPLLRDYLMALKTTTFGSSALTRPCPGI
jgi:hypothetical protein